MRDAGLPRRHGKLTKTQRISDNLFTIGGARGAAAQAGTRSLSQNTSFPPLPLDETEFRAIEATVTETDRGRAFLAEFARRNRSADTETLQAAIQKLQQVHQERQPREGWSQIRRDLLEMAADVARTRRDLSAIPAALEPSIGGSSEFSSIVAWAEKANADIVSAAEKIQEIARTLREQGVSAEFCETLDARANDVHTASSFQDLTCRRIDSAIAAFTTIEHQLKDLTAIWGFDEAEGAAPDGADFLPGPEDVAPGSPVPAARKPDAHSLELFRRLAADLEAAMRLRSHSAPLAPAAADGPRAVESEDTAEASATKASAPEAAAPDASDREPADEDSALANVSQAHRTALFT